MECITCFRLVSVVESEELFDPISSHLKHCFFTKQSEAKEPAWEILLSMLSHKQIDVDRAKFLLTKQREFAQHTADVEFVAVKRPRQQERIAEEIQGCL